MEGPEGACRVVGVASVQIGRPRDQSRTDLGAAGGSPRGGCGRGALPHRVQDAQNIAPVRWAGNFRIAELDGSIEVLQDHSEDLARAGVREMVLDTLIKLGAQIDIAGRHMLSRPCRVGLMRLVLFHPLKGNDFVAAENDQELIELGWRSPILNTTVADAVGGLRRGWAGE
jgi:hypothetical protein